MIEQIHEKLDQQGSAIKELKDLLQEEIKLRKEDQAKITQIESIVTEMNTRLEGKLNTAVAVTGLYEKLDQFELDRRCHEERLLAEMNKHLTENQAKLNASIETNSEQSRKIKIEKRLSAEEDNVVPAKLMKTEVDESIWDEFNEIQETFDNNSTTNSASSVRNGSYENWDDKSAKLKNTKFVDFKKLRDILDRVCEKETVNGYTLNLTPEEMTDARKNIMALTEVTINKYKRFPSNGIYVDINLNNKKNAELKKMLTATDTRIFFEAAGRYKFFIQDQSLDVIVFENRYGLKWTSTIETINID